MTIRPLATTDGHPFYQIGPNPNPPHKDDTPHDWIDHEWTDDEGELDAFETRETREARELTSTARTRMAPSPRRWRVTFTVIAVLLSAFSLIFFLALTQSDWLYGTSYDQITEAQWTLINDLRDQLVELDLAPEAVDALDHALVLPHPSDQAVISDLSQAAQALDAHVANAGACRIQAQLYALIGRIKPDFQPPSQPASTATPLPLLAPTLTPMKTSTPMMGALVAQH